MLNLKQRKLMRKFGLSCYILNLKWQTQPKNTLNFKYRKVIVLWFFLITEFHKIIHVCYSDGNSKNVNRIIWYVQAKFFICNIARSTVSKLPVYIWIQFNYPGHWIDTVCPSCVTLISWHRFWTRLTSTTEGFQYVQIIRYS